MHLRNPQCTWKVYKTLLLFAAFLVLGNFLLGQMESESIPLDAQPLRVSSFSLISAFQKILFFEKFIQYIFDHIPFPKTHAVSILYPISCLFLINNPWVQFTHAHTPGCAVIHWSVVDWSGATPLKKPTLPHSASEATHCPSSSVRDGASQTTG